MPAHHPRMKGRTFDECASLHYAAWLLAWLTSERGGDLSEALADYHAGPNRAPGVGEWYAELGRGSGAAEGRSGRMSQARPTIRTATLRMASELQIR